MTRSDRDKVIKEIGALPAMSGSAAGVLSLLNNPDADAARIESAVKYDPGLTANILRLANSAYFAAPGMIGSIRQAVVRLGWKRVYQLVIASSVHAAMDRPITGYGLPSGEFWRHAIAVSVAAEDLARECKTSDADEVFTAALLHDVGKLTMGSVVEADFGEIENAVAQGASFEEAERQTLGIDHAEAGAQILEKWSLPAVLVSAVRWHHDPDRSDPTSALVDVVHIADVLCLMIGIGIGRDGLQYKPSQAAISRLGIRTAHLERVASRTLQGVEELIEALE